MECIYLYPKPICISRKFCAFPIFFNNKLGRLNLTKSNSINVNILEDNAYMHKIQPELKSLEQLEKAMSAVNETYIEKSYESKARLEEIQGAGNKLLQEVKQSFEEEKSKVEESVDTSSELSKWGELEENGFYITERNRILKDRTVHSNRIYALIIAAPLNLSLKIILH